MLIKKNKQVTSGDETNSPQKVYKLVRVLAYFFEIRYL